MEDHCFGVCGLLHRELVHRVLVCDDARPLILVLEVVIQLADGVYITALTLGGVSLESHRGIDGLLALL